MKRRIIDNRMEITVVFGNLTIANSILLTTEGVFVNGNHFTSLFDAFSGILVMFMQQIRLLYLYHFVVVFTIEIVACVIIAVLRVTWGTIWLLPMGVAKLLSSHSTM